MSSSIGKGEAVAGAPPHNNNDDNTLLLLPDIYIRIYHGAIHKETWHVIKSSSSGNSRLRIVRANLPQAPKNITDASCAVIGSKIYMSGGIDRSLIEDGTFHITTLAVTNEVYSIDTNCPDDGWQEEPPMITKRRWHYAFADDDKLYALAGIAMEKCRPDADGKWPVAEVYDPNSEDGKKGWKILAGMQDIPGSCVSGHAVVKISPNEKKILFHTYYRSPIYEIFIGDEPDDHVGIYRQRFRGSCHASVFVDGILYYVDNLYGQTLFGYDVLSQNPGIRPKRVVFYPEQKQYYLPYRDIDDPVSEAHLLSLGNNYLAVLWAQERDFVPDGLVPVRCSIFAMSKVDNGGFRAEILKYTNFSLQRGSLTACLAMWPPQKVVGLDSERGHNTATSKTQQQSQSKRKREEGENIAAALLESSGD